jgi:hypothetical protein
MLPTWEQWQSFPVSDELELLPLCQPDTSPTAAASATVDCSASSQLSLIDNQHSTVETSMAHMCASTGCRPAKPPGALQLV